MNALKITARLVLAWIAMLLAQLVAGMVIHPNAPSNPNPLLWLMVSNAFIALPMGAAALRSDWRDWKLLRALFLVTAAISVANWIEGAWYLSNAGLDWRGVFAFNVVSIAIAAILWFFIFRSAPVPEANVSSNLPERSFTQKLWRFALCSACYVLLYFGAGTIIFPFVRDYYATQHLPSFGQIVGMQFFVRGPVFVLVCLALLRMFRLPNRSGAVAVGLAFTLMSGVATLIMPNGIFPDIVRRAHLCEVSSSNFVFGFLVAWIWGQTQRVRHLVHASA
jgi:hypothetical protein